MYENIYSKACSGRKHQPLAESFKDDVIQSASFSWQECCECAPPSGNKAFLQVLSPSDLTTLKRHI